MSKLADKIRKASRLEQSAIGFGAARVTTEPSMVLVGIARDATTAEQLRAKGADAVIVGAADAAAPVAAAPVAAAPVAAAPVSTAGGAKDDITGGWIAGDGDAGAMKDGGYDFVIFDPDNTPSTAVLEESIGYVLALPADISDMELRSIESFQLDAIAVGTLENALTVRKQIDLRRVFALTRKPLMATVTGTVAGPQLQALRDTNVIAVAASTPEDVERLRKTIDGLPPRVRRKDDERPTPLVPRTSGAEEEPEHDHDE